LNSLVGFPLPSPPEAEVTTKVKAVPNEPSAESVAELLRLYPEAKLVRANSSKHRVEAEAFTKLLNHVHAPVAEGGEGVSLYRLSEVLGVTHGGLRSRLGRYGYKPSAAYKPIKSGNRVN
jgi:hypothetical protein